MRETQDSIGRWADQTFGAAPEAVRIATRANEEMAELLRKCSRHAPAHEIAEEAADVVIVLYCLCRFIGYRLDDEIDRKMTINRERRWHVDESGHGRHVREEAAAPEGRGDRRVAPPVPGTPTDLSDNIDEVDADRLAHLLDICEMSPHLSPKEQQFIEDMRKRCRRRGRHTCVSDAQ